MRKETSSVFVYIIPSLVLSLIQSYSSIYFHTTLLHLSLSMNTGHIAPPCALCHLQLSLGPSLSPHTNICIPCTPRTACVSPFYWTLYTAMPHWSRTLRGTLILNPAGIHVATTICHLTRPTLILADGLLHPSIGDLTQENDWVMTVPAMTNGSRILPPAQNQRHSQLSVCAVCLGRHAHSVFNCNALKTWDGAHGAVSKRVKGELLLRSTSTPLCLEWQRSRGCPSNKHDAKHFCSGCNQASHRAQGCPRSQKI